METALLQDLQAQMAELMRRIAVLEKETGPAVEAAAPPVEPAGISEEELLAISAAVAAYLGVRAHIRQIRLAATSAWAQQGRVSIQASHRLQG